MLNENDKIMTVTNEIRNDIRQGVCESSEMDSPVVKFVSGNELTDKVCELIWSGDLDGLYYNEDGEIIAMDVWGEEHKAEK